MDIAMFERSGDCHKFNKVAFWKSNYSVLDETCDLCDNIGSTKKVAKACGCVYVSRITRKG